MLQVSILKRQAANMAQQRLCRRRWRERAWISLERSLQNLINHDTQNYNKDTKPRRRLEKRGDMVVAHEGRHGVELLVVKPHKLQTRFPTVMPQAGTIRAVHLQIWPHSFATRSSIASDYPLSRSASDIVKVPITRLTHAVHGPPVQPIPQC